MLVPLQVTGNLMVAGLSLAMALYELWLWRSRREPVHGWGGAFALGQGLYAAVHGWQYVVTDGSILEWIIRVDTVALIACVICLSEWGEASSKRSAPIGRRVRFAMAAVVVPVVLFTDVVIQPGPTVTRDFFGTQFHTLPGRPIYIALLLSLVVSVLVAASWTISHLKGQPRRWLRPALWLWLATCLHDFAIFITGRPAVSFLLEYGFLAWIVAVLALDVATYARLLDDASRASVRFARELTGQRKAFHDVFATAPMPVLVHQGGTIVYANRRAEEALEVDAGGLLGGPLLELVDAGSRSVVTRSLIEEPSASDPVEVVLRSSTSRAVHWEAYTLPVAFDGTASVAVVARDVTERKEMLAKTMTFDRMAAAGTLAAGVAHEINNPLTYIMGNLEHVRAALVSPEEFDNDEVAEAVDEALSGSQRIRDIVQDLGRLARPRSFEGSVDLAELITSAARLVHNEARHRARVVLRVHSVRVVGDASRLGQVFVNLLVNALQAIPLGSSQSDEVEVRIEDAGDDVVVSVRDTGAGIAADALHQIFDPFFTTKPVGEGTGLGLAICRETVLACGGEIWAESEVGTGTTFFVRLCRALDEHTTSTSPPDAVAIESHDTHVLVVDDEASVCRAIQRMLRGRYRVTTTTSAREALQWLEKGLSVDVIICDVMMPDLTGREFYDRVRTHDPKLADAVVMMSGGAFGDLKAWLEALPNVRLQKPFDADELVALLGEYNRPRSLPAIPHRIARP